LTARQAAAASGPAEMLPNIHRTDGDQQSSVDGQDAIVISARPARDHWLRFAARWRTRELFLPPLP